MQNDGYSVGMFVPIALIVVPLVIVIVRMRRSTANPKCHLSLVLLLGSWLIPPALILAFERTPLPVVGFVGGGLLLMGMALSAIFAILGLLEFRSLPGQYVEGRGPAITSFVLIGLMGIGVLIGAVVGIAQGTTRFRQARESAVATRTSFVPVVFENLGFSIRANPPWVKVEPAQLNPVATAAFLRRNPEAYFIIIAEKLDPGAGVTSETLTSVVKANLLGGEPSAKVLEEAPEILNGREGVRLVCEARVKGLDIIYRYWVHATAANAYQLLAWGQKGSRAAVLSEAKKAFEGFEVIPEKK